MSLRERSTGERLDIFWHAFQIIIFETTLLRAPLHCDPHSKVRSEHEGVVGGSSHFTYLFCREWALVSQFLRVTTADKNRVER